MYEKYEAYCIEEIEVDTGIVIREGAVGNLIMNGPSGWPMFETATSGYTFDLAIPKDQLSRYFTW